MANKVEIIELIANKYHLPKSQVERAIHAQFKYAKQFMERDSMPTVRLPYFGKFIINKKVIQQIENAKRIKANQQNEKDKKES